ncbi:UNVERIFIED_CONTAM: hypothetical protein K2H54_003918 [Gekko kuhli]
MVRRKVLPGALATMHPTFVRHWGREGERLQQSVLVGLAFWTEHKRWELLWSFPCDPPPLPHHATGIKNTQSSGYRIHKGLADEQGLVAMSHIIPGVRTHPSGLKPPLVRQPLQKNAAGGNTKRREFHLESEGTALYCHSGTHKLSAFPLDGHQGSRSGFYLTKTLL